MKRVAIIMPAYNEEKRIGKTLETYSEYFNGLVREKIIDYEILVVINNTKDRTADIVRGFCFSNKRILYLDLEKGGKGHAVIEGFKDTLKRNSDFIGFVDADMATLPEAFFELVKNIGRFDGVIASRWVKGAIVTPRPSFRRKIARWMFNSLIKALLFLPYRDTQCGAKVFRKQAIEGVLSNLTMSRWAFDVDLLYSLRKIGFRIKEIPTVWADKEYSKINFWSAGPWMALGVIRLRIMNSPFKKMIRIYDLLTGMLK